MWYPQSPWSFYGLFNVPWSFCCLWSFCHFPNVLNVLLYILCQLRCLQSHVLSLSNRLIFASSSVMSLSVCLSISHSLSSLLSLFPLSRLSLPLSAPPSDVPCFTSCVVLLQCRRATPQSRRVRHWRQWRRTATPWWCARPRATPTPRSCGSRTSSQLTSPTPDYSCCRPVSGCICCLPSWSYILIIEL